MSAVRMDGKALSAKVRGSILAETEALKKQGVTPGLAVIIVGNDPASEIYVRNKERACEQCGFYSEKYALPEETTQEELLGLIAQLNESPAISGILCQMPVPKHISEQAVIDAIGAELDETRLTDPYTFKVYNMYMNAAAIVRGAIDRKESVGAHYLAD